MGSCTSSSTKSLKRTSSFSDRVQEQTRQSPNIENEIYCLKLIYEDLVSRCLDRSMHFKTFQLFFHMNHVIGGSLFRIFWKTHKDKIITQQMFIEAVYKYSKECTQDRMKFLFSLYDLNESDGISFNQMLAIFLNFPQEEIKQVLSKDQFLQSLTSEQISYYLIASKKADRQNLYKLYKSSLSLFPHIPIRKSSSNLQGDLYAIGMCSNTQENVQERISQRKFLKQQFRKSIDKTTLTTQIFRKYTQYVFKKHGINKENDEISFSVFKTIFKEHPKLYQQCFEGFHQYLWKYDNEVPLYKKKIPTICGFCIQKRLQRSQRVYLVNIKNSLLTFESQEMSKPLSIKNLEGLIIEQTQNEEGFGFIIKHQDGFYPQVKYLFTKPEIQQEWIRQLYQYQQQNIFKKYILQQKIGKGNFSNVYKAESVENGQKRAIKIIDKQIMSQSQLNAVNSQSQILATCVMPNVVRAFQRFQTKTHIYLVTQLLEGGSLYQYAKKKPTQHLSQKQTKKIMKLLLTTIKQLHSIGIIHRDLKLQNILMKIQGEDVIPKIIDFGLAVFAIALPTLDQKSKYAGTPNFVPPEIFYHADYDQTVDVFSLGVIMHFLLTGALPFHGLNQNVIRQLTIQCFVNFQTKRWANISSQAKDLLAKMICYRQYRINAEQALNHQWFNQNNPQFPSNP